MRRHCGICGRPYEAKTNASRYCGSTCRNRKARGSAPIAETVGELPAQTRAQLEAAGRLDTVIGQQAVRLAEQIRVETGSSLAALTGSCGRRWMRRWLMWRRSLMRWMS